MRKVLIALGSIILLLLVLAGSGLLWVRLALPKVGPAPSLKVEPTPARLERGAYLSKYVADCAGCHSPRLPEQSGLPADEARAFTGGFEISKLLADIPGDITTQ